MAKLKFKAVESTVADAVSVAFGELSSLAEECREIVDNASEGLRETSRIQTLDDTAGTLEQHTDEPDVDEKIAGLKVTYQEWTNARKGRGLSRADRCGFACSVLESVIDVLDTDSGPAGQDHHGNTVAELMEALRDELDTAKSDCEGLDFPGMYG